MIAQPCEYDKTHKITLLNGKCYRCDSQPVFSLGEHACECVCTSVQRLKDYFM